MLQLLREATVFQASVFFLVANAIIFACSIVLCWGLGRAFGNKRIFDSWEPLRPIEMVAAIGAVILNAAVSVVGWWLWVHGLISLRPTGPLALVFDCTLMIVFLMCYPITLGGLLAYLALNILFGTLGHSGVEPFPRSFQSLPVIRLLGTSTFHAEHHEHPSYNFGFYTLLWDKLFGTLDPEYVERFEQRS